MCKVRQRNLPFNTTPLGSWSQARDRKRYDRAAFKLAAVAGLTLPVAQAVAELNGLGGRERW